MQCVGRPLFCWTLRRHVTWSHDQIVTAPATMHNTGAPPAPTVAGETFVHSLHAPSGVFEVSAMRYDIRYL